VAQHGQRLPVFYFGASQWVLLLASCALRKWGGVEPCVNWFRNGGFSFTPDLKAGLLGLAAIPLLAALLQPSDDAKGALPKFALFVLGCLIWLLVYFGSSWFLFLV
jgi:hypothetical protein